MISLSTRVRNSTGCWNQIGVWGDRSCPELAEAVHCYNCPVFAATGRQFLDAPSPEGYLEEWAERLAPPVEERAADFQSVLLFRIEEEWLALPVGVVVEVTHPRQVHRIPYRGGVLAGLVNVRGELHLCARLEQLLGITRPQPRAEETERSKGQAPRERNGARLVVIRRDKEDWAIPVDEVEGVGRVGSGELLEVPPTVGRTAARFARWVFARDGHKVGYLDDGRLFDALRTILR